MILVIILFLMLILLALLARHMSSIDYGFDEYINDIKYPYDDKLTGKVGGHASKFENDIRAEFEKIFIFNGTRHKFASARPGWLTAKCLPSKAVLQTGPDTKSYNIKISNKSLELDGFCPALSIAFEAQGPLHSKWSKSEETYKKYERRIATDVFKRDCCAKNGILLIVVDYRLNRSIWSAYIRSRVHDAVVAGNNDGTTNDSRANAGPRPALRLPLAVMSAFADKPEPYVPPDDISGQKFDIYKAPA